MIHFQTYLNKLFCNLLLCSCALLFLSCVDNKHNQAKRLFDQGNLSESRQIYASLSEKSPENRYFKGMLALIDGNYDSAESLLTSADITSAYSVLGKGALLKKDFTHALTFYTHSRKNKNLSSTLYMELGMTYFQLAKYKEAKDIFKKSLVLDPKNPQALLGLGKTCYTRLEFDEALTAYKKAVKIKPNFPEAFTSMAQLYEFITDYDKANDAYMKAIALDPSHNDAYLGLSTLRLKQHNWNESVHYFNQYSALTQPSPTSF